MTSLIMAADTIGLNKISEFLKALVVEYKHKQLVTRTIKELSALNDKELNDIGISRGDIYWVANDLPKGDA